MSLEDELHDEALYTDPARKQELTTLMQRHAALKTSLADLEHDWLEASEALEEAERALRE